MSDEFQLLPNPLSVPDPDLISDPTSTAAPPPPASAESSRDDAHADDRRQDWILPADLQTALVGMLTDIMNGLSPNDRPVSFRTQVMAAHVLATLSQLNIDQAKIDRASKE